MYTDAVKAIKTAILQGQYEAAKSVNRVQLAVYYGTGKYLSEHSRNGQWGTFALKVISEQLQREMPGLRGFSERNLYEMRAFYESWSAFNSISAVATAKLSDSTEVVDIQSVANLIEVESFPIDDFFRVPFTHHMLIAKAAKQKEERYYYIHRTAEENLSVSSLKQIIKEDAYGHQGQMPNNFAATISDAAQARKAVMMFKDEYLLNFINVEEIGERDALPDEVALRKVLCGGEE